MANKKDLEDERVVLATEGQKLAESFSTQHSKIIYTEVSAKTGEGVHEAFFEISRKVKE